MAIFPLNDDAPLKHIRYPYVTIALISICALVFFYQLSLPERASEIFVFCYGAIPAALLGNVQLPPEISKLPVYSTLISSMFLHGNFMHIICNMLFLWVLGDNVEDLMGHKRYLCFYVLCGIIAAFVHAISDPMSRIPMIGASGAISGVVGAYLILHPRAPIRVLVWFFIIWLPSWIVLGCWIAYQFLSVAMATGGAGGGVAWWAHIGGFVVGTILIVFMRRKDTPILDRNYIKVDHRLLSTRPRNNRHGHRGPSDC